MELFLFLAAVAIVGFGVYYLGPSITSFVIREFSHADEINLVVTSSGNYTWQLQGIGGLVSARIDGRMTAYGKARAYIESDGVKYLIFDSTMLNETKEDNFQSNNSITGFAVKEDEDNDKNKTESDKEKKDKNKKPEWVGEDEFDVNGATLINLSGQFFGKDGDLLVYAVSDAEGLKTSIDNEMVTIAPESDENFNTTITFTASDGVDSRSHIVDLIVNANINPIINETINQTPEIQPINITPTINLTMPINDSILNQTPANETINITMPKNEKINETINLTQPVNETINATITNETNLTAANATKTI